MPATTFSPKQVALALGVSESSVKRWVDSGKLPAAKTGGGHRKVTLPTLADFVRETGHPIAVPEMLGMVATGSGKPIDTARDQLFEALVAGREGECREVILGFYQQGESIDRLGDMLVSPVFRRIGEGWAAGTVQVYQERRACEVMMATLHELRRWMPDAWDNAPLAMVATPLRDFAEVPIRLVELTLTSLGWRVIASGSGLPLAEIRTAAVTHKPQLLCLSATHLEDPNGFLEMYNEELLQPLRKELPKTVHVLGGGAVESPDLAQESQADHFTATLAELVSYLEKVKLLA